MTVAEFPFTAQSVGKLAFKLYAALRDRRLRLPDDADLLDELAHVRLRETSPGVYRLDHDADRHDDRAIALALCIEALGEAETIEPGALCAPVGATKSSAWRVGGETIVVGNGAGSGRTLGGRWPIEAPRGP